MERNARVGRFLSEMGFDFGTKDTRTTIDPKDLVNPMLRAYQDGVKPAFVKDEVRKQFPNVADFDKKFADALVVLQNAPVSKEGNDIFGRSLKDSRGFLGFLRLVYSVSKPAVEAVKDPSKAPEIIRQQFERFVVPNAPQALQQPLRQGSQLAQKGIKSDLGKKLIEKL